MSENSKCITNNFENRVLKIGYWNLNGLYRSDGTCKSEETEFEEIIRKHDIFCISEVHCNEQKIPPIQKYSCFKICRQKTEKINRFFGGIAIYYKSSLRKGIKFVQSNNEDLIWIKLCKNFFGTEKDTLICVTYIPPENSTYYKVRGIDTMELLENDIVKMRLDGTLCILGDINARTNIDLDFVENDEALNEDLDILYDVDKISIVRSSQDKGDACKRGKTLLEICKAARLRIVNGRCLGDAIGMYTCHRPLGSSVVDYFITEEENLKNVEYFEVGDYKGNISDHCNICAVIKCNTTKHKIGQAKKEQLGKNLRALFKYRWNTLAFQTALENEEIQSRIQQFLEKTHQLDDKGVNNMVEEISGIFIMVAEKSLKKTYQRWGIAKNIKYGLIKI